MKWLVRVWGSPYYHFEYVVEGSYSLAMKTTDRYPSGFICDAIPFGSGVSDFRPTINPNNEEVTDEE